MNKLYIDTRDNKRIIVRLETDGGSFEEKSEATIKSAQTILPLVEKVLKRAKVDVKEIEEIKVERGPGSFTGVRVGISIANTLGFGLNIKINGKKAGEIESPQY